MVSTNEKDCSTVAVEPNVSSEASNKTEETEIVEAPVLNSESNKTHADVGNSQSQQCNYSEETAGATAIGPSNSNNVSSTVEKMSLPSESTQHQTSNDRLLGLIQSQFVQGIVKPEDLNVRSSTQPVGRDLGDVTLNLTEFLSYAQRNNYDVVIPISREASSMNSELPRIGSGRGYMVLEQQHFPRDFTATSGTTYPPSEFININTLPPRNSVLAPSMYHPAEELQPPAVDFNAPPPYEMPLKLPTYEEVQREKALEGEMLPSNMGPQNADANSPRALSFLAIDTDMGNNADPESKLLGTDFMFAIAFFLALIFNWIGFLLLMCFCHTVAARYGALSGFGLSLAKWTVIVKNSTDVPIHNAWLWWLITAFGLLICIRSLFQYVNIKRGWRLMSTATQERLLFFY